MIPELISVALIMQVCLCQPAPRPACPYPEQKPSAEMVCPAAEKVATCQPCTDNNDCQCGMLCCSGLNNTKSCTYSEGNLMAVPEVSPVIVGSMAMGSGSIMFETAVTLIKSQGRNILVDPGNSKRADLISGLHSVGVNPEDIHTVIFTHGHPDHFLRADMFINAEMVFAGFRFEDTMFIPNPLMGGPEAVYRLCVQDVYLINTPGHTLQDVTVIVEGGTDQGNTAIVGDLILFGNDDETYKKFPAANAAALDSSRKRVMCMADTIIPGHGSMFKADEAVKERFKCSGSSRLSFDLFILLLVLCLLPVYL